MKHHFRLLCIALFVLGCTSWLAAQTFVGDATCMGCHGSNDPTNVGYDLAAEYFKTGHPWKLNPVDGAPPTYPDNTSPGVPFAPPAQPDWNTYAYVIGGYGWKARFVQKDGKIFTADEQAQYNLETQGWVPYHFGETKYYNYNCFKCHTTGPSPEGSWNGVPEDSLGTFVQPGVRCEACHGPGSDHVASPSTVTPPIVGDSLKYDRCGDCHTRGSKTNAIPVSGGYIKHHEQYNEMKATRHNDLGFTCATCHDAHIALRYPDAAGAGLDAIKTKCEDCHANKQILVNGVPKPIECVDCHMPDASKSAVGKQVGNGWRGDVATHIWKINTAAVPRDSMFTADGKVKLDANGHAAVTMDFACLKCHREKTVEWAAQYATDIHTNGITTTPDEYVGSSICMQCHNEVNAHLGYNIWEEFMKTGHPYKLNKVMGGPPTYPENTSPGVPNAPPAQPDWNAYAWVIGGYGWKARFVQPDGRIFTADSSAQYNLETQGWVPYHFGEEKYYNYNCFKCHTTGPTPNGSWSDITADLGTFSEPGIRCEGCHGPGGAHVADPTNVKPPITADSLAFTRCGDCHSRGSKTNVIPASKGYIRHHEQFNEMKASPHGDGNGTDLTCGTCHDTHLALLYPQAAGEGLNAIKLECSSCHPNHEIQITRNGQTTTKPIECEDCHMPPASKSAVGMQAGNGWRGDVATHIWRINTKAEPRDSMFTADGGSVRLDANGLAAVTLDFACLRCHQNETVDWAAAYAQGIHETGIVGVDEPVAQTIPSRFMLEQNYPNPFNPSTTIQYDLPRTSKVRLAIYNIIGEEVATLVDGVMPPGSHKIVFEANDLPSGIYIYKLETPEAVMVKKMILLK